MRGRTQIIGNANFTGIPAGQTFSDVIDLGGESIITGISTPNASPLDGKVVTFYQTLKSGNDGVPQDYLLVDKAGANYTVTLAQNKTVNLPEEITKMAINLKMKIGVALGANVSAYAILVGYGEF